ncbi:MAG TPA: hypothetical protein EYG85_04220 [Crocinitomix sp.]|nr:hypothetical protein [Crocinitomix sp.]
MNKFNLKYRRLNAEELKYFEKEFIDFLVINGITVEDWVSMKKEYLEKAETIIEKFSDVIFESILRKTKYIDFISPKSIKTFHCLPNEMVLVGVDAPKNSNIDFTQNLTSDLTDLEVYTHSKKYNKQREIEIFQLINSGAQISKGEWFKKLCLLL